jgi:ankyrin repeat protein
VTDLNQDLLSAIDGRDATAVRDLLAKGADANAQDQAGRTALMHATLQGDTDTMQTLIAAGADSNAEANLGETALVLAAISFSERTLPVLIGHGGDVNAQDSNSKSVLMWAVDPQFHRGATSNPDVVRSLLAAGADQDVADNRGRTALMWALTASEERDLSLPVIEVLLDGGANVHARENRGMTPLMMLIERCKGAELASGKAAAAVNLLIGKGSDVNAVDKSGKTVLMWAKGKETMRRLLKQAGAKQ